MFFLVVIFLVGGFYTWDFYKEDVPVKIEGFAEEAEFYEDYISLVFDESDEPILLETVNEDESKIFIEKIKEVNLNPENILKAGNELFFTSAISKDDNDGVALFTYDVVMRKFKELYFYKQEKNNTNTKFILKAIDVVGNKLVVVLQDKGVGCESLWLGQEGNFYTYNLLDNDKDGLIKYDVPGWKTKEEESGGFVECD